MRAHMRPGVTVRFEDHGGKLGVVPHLQVPFDAYFALVDELVVHVARNKKFRPSQVVAITFGGVVPGRAIAQAFNLPLAYLGAESYVPSADDDQRRMEPSDDVTFARDLLTTRSGFGARVLLVDDLTDRGTTFRAGVRRLHHDPKYGSGIDEIKTACLWRKTHSVFTPDYAVDFVERLRIPQARRHVMPWIDQPLERLYALASIGDIERRIKQRNDHA
ncbi:hypothetical protein HY480_02230 [Candidatus Uhrbacteria bacterium]|nr:hypothetical protein [Candidatus Uhrbacteria bacterium]